MSEAVKKITTDKHGNTVLTVKWNGRTFMVQVGEGGVVVGPPNEQGSFCEAPPEYPNVWIDPNDINNTEGDPNDEPLLVHSYFDNEQEAPVTVTLTKDKAGITGDGLPFAEIKRNPFTPLNIVD